VSHPSSNRRSPGQKSRPDAARVLPVQWADVGYDCDIHFLERAAETLPALKLPELKAPRIHPVCTD